MRYILIIFLLMGCKTSFYNELPEIWKERVHRTDDLEKLDRYYIYPVTGIKLREELFRYEDSMVVTFVNKCTSEYCLPLKSYENYAIKNKYKLFLVMQDLNHLDESYNQYFYSPLLVIDEEYYKGIWSSSKRFNEDLLGDEYQKKHNGSIYIFKRGSLIHTMRSLSN